MAIGLDGCPGQSERSRGELDSPLANETFVLQVHVLCNAVYVNHTYEVVFHLPTASQLLLFCVLIDPVLCR